MEAGYSAQQREQLAAALRARAPLACPACATALSAQPVEPRPDVSYVRHRVWLMCPACKRSASFDVRADERP
jgi:hypothetical protein